MAKKSTKGRGKKPPPPKLTIRRNGAPIEVMRNAAPIVPVRAASMRRNSADGGQKPARKSRKPIKKRLQSNGGSHVAAGALAWTAGTAFTTIAIGQGWMKPTTAGLTMLGTGALATTAGYVTEHDHVMWVGAGVTAAGASTLTQYYAFAASEAITERAKKKKQQASEQQAHDQDKAETGKASKPPAERRNGGSYIRLVREHETI